jgi:Mg/Co/Ni transporter MgtE
LDVMLEDASAVEEKRGTVLSAVSVATTRFMWLSGLLLLQSLSSFVLEAHAELIRKHLVVTLFLTMLVGAGGNAGAQAAVSVIRAIALKKIATRQHVAPVLMQEGAIGMMLALGLFFVGFVRVLLTRGVWGGEAVREALTIGAALFLIVLFSVVIGACLPLLFHFVLKVDPAHAGSSVQVVMDVLGVTITCIIATITLTQ